MFQRNEMKFLKFFFFEFLTEKKEREKIQWGGATSLSDGNCVKCDGAHQAFLFSEFSYTHWERDRWHKQKLIDDAHFFSKWKKKIKLDCFHALNFIFIFSIYVKKNSIQP